MQMSERELLSVNLEATGSNWTKYSRQYSKRLPSGTVLEFKWKDYYPGIFRLIQEIQNIDHEDYMLSVCGSETLKKVSSQGKSGIVFLLSQDDRFVIKTLKKSEVKDLLEMLPNYYIHLKKYPASLLTKLYGIHVVEPVGGLKVYFAVVSNVLPSDVFMHRVYDLKGSLQGRTANKIRVREKTILKDQDLDFCFYLDPLTRHRLLAQIKYDCEFLEAEGIMDYSIMLGMHIEASHQGSVDSRRSCSVSHNSSCRGSVDSRSSSSKRTVSRDSSQRGSVDSRSFSIKTTMSNGSLQGNEETGLTFADLCQEPMSHGIKFGTQMRAHAVQIPKNMMGSGSSHQRAVQTDEYHDVSLYFGLVDIFQSYNMIKRIEHAYKSLHYDSKSISSVNPKLYSSRFQDFLGKLFQPEDSDFESHNKLWIKNSAIWSTTSTSSQSGDDVL